MSVRERRVLFPLLRRFFGESHADMELMEQVLRGSDLDWPVVRPPRLIDGAASGHYRSAIGRPLERARTISRADLAAAILDLATDPDASRPAVVVAS